MTSIDYLDHLARESARFADALRSADPGTSVPSCPEWDADDLLWHLGEVQWLWGTIVNRGITDGGDVDRLEHPDRPGDHDGLLAFYAGASRDLHSGLSAQAPDSAAWTWATDHTVGFIRRRQAHEALIHRIDAELTADARTPMDTTLSADGVDEVLRVMYGGNPPWGQFTPDADQSVRVRTTDTGDSWVLTLGRFTGTDPDDPSTSYTDEPDMRIAEADDGRATGAEISGTAADVDCWLWHRPALGEVTRTGDPAVLAAFDAAISPGIN